jgi:hypothetical protein
MAIYLDANVLYSWKTFTELERVALTIVAQQIRQKVLIPDVAAWEAEAHFRRALERALRDLARAQKATGDAFRGQEIVHPPPPDVEARVVQWRDELGQFAETIPLDHDDAAEAYRREAFGQQPAKRRRNERGDDIGGTGGRDAAIWLTIVRDHAARGEEGHLITSNVKDFGGTDELKPALRDDISANAPTLHNYGSTDDFLALLGRPKRDAPVDLADVQRRLPRVLRVVLPSTSHVPRAIFGEDFDWHAFHYVTDLKAARVTRVVASRRYEQETEAITVVNAVCELVVKCLRFSRDEEIGTVVGYDDARISGAIQFYLPDDEELLVQVISARLTVDFLPPVIVGVGG